MLFEAYFNACLYLIHAGALLNPAVKQEARLPATILGSKAVERCFARNGSYLLPHAFPDGFPQHPSYLQGHGTVAGACTTVLKAFFDETWEIPNPVISSEDSTHLLSYQGSEALTVGGELNKLV